MSILTCPVCYKDMHPVCTNKKCKCRMSIPDGEKPMINRAMIWRVIVPYKLFNFIWHKFPNARIIMDEMEECPYCGYKNSMDYWDNRNMGQTFTEDWNG
jgi:hypothetical protein